MTWPQFIASIELSNARLFKAERIAMKPETFREQLRLAYFAGLDQADAEFAKTARNGMPDFFKGIFSK